MDSEAVIEVNFLFPLQDLREGRDIQLPNCVSFSALAPPYQILSNYCDQLSLRVHRRHASDHLPWVCGGH